MRDLPRGDKLDKLDKLLEELHAKKNWLDTVITGLEAAMESPHHQLIAAAAERFEVHADKTPKVDWMDDGSASLLELALRVGGGRPAPHRRNGHKQPIKM